MGLATISEAIDEIRRGRAIILVDDEDRENEGDLVVAAEKITPEWVNFMATHGRGLICLTLTEERASELKLPFMVEQNTTQYQTAFTVSIEAREGVTTGISAQDRATTIRTARRPLPPPPGFRALSTPTRSSCGGSARVRRSLQDEEGALGLLAELGAQDAKAARGVAEAPGSLAGRQAFDEVGA